MQTAADYEQLHLYLANHKEVDVSIGSPRSEGACRRALTCRREGSAVNFVVIGVE